MKRGLEIPDRDLPRVERPPRRAHDPAFEARLERLKAARNRLAAELDLAPGVLCPNGTLGGDRPGQPDESGRPGGGTRAPAMAARGARAGAAGGCEGAGQGDRKGLGRLQGLSSKTLQSNELSILLSNLWPLDGAMLIAIRTRGRPAPGDPSCPASSRAPTPARPPPPAPLPGPSTTRFTSSMISVPAGQPGTGQGHPHLDVARLADTRRRRPARCR